MVSSLGTGLRSSLYFLSLAYMVKNNICWINEWFNTLTYYIVPAISKLDFILPFEQMRRGFWRCEIICSSRILGAELMSLTQLFYMCFTLRRNMFYRPIMWMLLKYGSWGPEECSTNLRNSGSVSYLSLLATALAPRHHWGCGWARTPS